MSLVTEIDSEPNSRSALYPVCAREGRWNQREKALLAMLWPYIEDKLASLMIAAREVAAGLREELGVA